MRTLSLVMAVVLAACTSRLALPTMAADYPLCRGIGTVAILTGDRSDARLAWLTGLDGTGREDLIWPPGYTAQFTPNLEIFDGSGMLVFRAGDHVDGACVESMNPRLVRIVPKPRASPTGE